MKREIIHELCSWRDKKKRKPLLLKGARQVGKTYALKEFGQQHFKKFHYLNFEENEDLFKIFEGNLKPERIIQEISFNVNSEIKSVISDHPFFPGQRLRIYEKKPL